MWRKEKILNSRTLQQLCTYVNNIIIVKLNSFSKFITTKITITIVITIKIALIVKLNNFIINIIKLKF